MLHARALHAVAPRPGSHLFSASFTLFFFYLFCLSGIRARSILFETLLETRILDFETLLVTRGIGFETLFVAGRNVFQTLLETRIIGFETLLAVGSAR